MILKWFKEFFEDETTIINRNFEKLNEYDDVKGIYDFKNLINLLTNEFFESLTNDAILYNKKAMGNAKEKNLYQDYLPFFISASKILNNSRIPIHNSSIHFVDYICLNALEFIIEFNYYHHNPSTSLEQIFKKAIGGDFIANVTFNVEDYENSQFIAYDYNDYFKKMSKIKLADERAKNLQSLIEDNIVHRVIAGSESVKFYKNIKFSGYYLAACSALKHDRNVTCEDMLTGYNLSIRFLIEDLTQYIERDYSELKVSQYDLFKKI